MRKISGLFIHIYPLSSSANVIHKSRVQIIPYKSLTMGVDFVTTCKMKQVVHVIKRKIIPLYCMKNGS
jgi:hypothetical protein